MKTKEEVLKLEFKRGNKNVRFINGIYFYNPPELLGKNNTIVLFSPIQKTIVKNYVCPTDGRKADIHHRINSKVISGGFCMLSEHGNSNYLKLN